MIAVHIRLDIDTTMDKIKEYILTISPDKYIIAGETKNKVHFHCVVFIPKLTQYVSRKMNKEIKTLFNITELRKISIALDRGKSEIYVLKENNYIHHGYTDQEIKALAEQSYQKDKSKKEFQELDEEYLSTDLQYKVYIRRYIRLKISHQIGLSDYRLREHFRLYFLMKNEHAVEFYARTYDSIEDDWECSHMVR